MSDVVNKRKPGVTLKRRTVLAAAGHGLLAALLARLPGAAAQSGPLRFAVIGDFGAAGPAEQDVATMVRSWDPEFIVTTGDNNYENGGASTIDANVGQYYHDFIYPYRGVYGAGADRNRFFPTLGNHDWYTWNAQPYLDYFTLPGKERYYDLVWGPVHLFALDSDPHEPDGTAWDSVQGQWLQARLAASTASWRLVFCHHAPYSSGAYEKSTPYMQWPFRAWGATAVLAGHSHQYERLQVGGFPYFVNGLGGASMAQMGTPIEGSQVRYNKDYGAMLLTADDTSLNFKFITRTGALIDDYTLSTTPAPSPTLPAAPDQLAARAISRSQIALNWRDNAADELGFIVERSTSSTVGFKQIARLSANTGSYVNGGLAKRRTYYYRVAAYNSGGQSPYSLVGSATTFR